MTKLSNFVLGLRELVSEDEAIQSVRRSKKYGGDLDDGPSNALLIFSTKNQQTWLVATTRRLYVVLDDVRKDQPSILWSTGNLNLELRVESKSERTGLLFINKRTKAFLFTKHLFSAVSIESQIEALLASVEAFAKA